MALDIELYRRTLYAPARDRWQSPETGKALRRLLIEA